MNLILFGFKGSGKTHLGKLLAKEVGCAFIDTDELIEKKYREIYGNTISNREIYQLLGEEGFRELERVAILSLKDVKNSVIALGGGAIILPENLKILEKIGILVYLQVDKETLKKRSFSGPLPAIYQAGDPDKSFDQLYEERLRLYEKIPAKKIDLAHKSEQQIIKELKSIYGK